MSAASVSSTTLTRIDALVKTTASDKTDSQGRHLLSFTQSDAQSLMYALADELGFDVTKR